MKNYTLSQSINKGLISTVSKKFKEVNLFVRKRKLKDTHALINSLNIFISQNMSLQTLSYIYRNISAESISDTAFKKLFQKDDKFQQVYESLLQTENAVTKPRKILGNKHSFLLDTTVLSEEGNNNNLYKIHTCYGLTKNNVSQVKVTDSHTAETACNFNIISNAIYFGDRAYSTTRQMKYVAEHNADFVFRFKTNGAILYADKELKQRFNVEKYLKNTTEQTVTKVVYLQSGLKLRFIASRLNEFHTNQAIKKAKKESGSGIQQSTIQMCEWLMLITSLVGKHSTNAIFTAYRQRWQIELHFKRFKTFLSLRKIRKSSKKYAFSLIYIALILWFCLEQHIEKCNIHEDSPYNHIKNSLWAYFSLALFEFNNIGFS